MALLIALAGLWLLALAIRAAWREIKGGWHEHDHEPERVTTPPTVRLAFARLARRSQ